MDFLLERNKTADGLYSDETVVLMDFLLGRNWKKKSERTHSDGEKQLVTMAIANRA